MTVLLIDENQEQSNNTEAQTDIPDQAQGIEVDAYDLVAGQIAQGRYICSRDMGVSNSLA